ncbi:MAG: hypothetical protein LBF62_00345 [Tannerellaceae bacterium]|nr:hypothetical protein [Tannerellaceae bacterium]
MAVNKLIGIITENLVRTMENHLTSHILHPSIFCPTAFRPTARSGVSHRLPNRKAGAAE